MVYGCSRPASSGQVVCGYKLSVATRQEGPAGLESNFFDVYSRRSDSRHICSAWVMLENARKNESHYEIIARTHPLWAYMRCQMVVEGGVMKDRHACCCVPVASSPCSSLHCVGEDGGDGGALPGGFHFSIDLAIIQSAQTLTSYSEASLPFIQSSTRVGIRVG